MIIFLFGESSQKVIHTPPNLFSKTQMRKIVLRYAKLFIIFPQLCKLHYKSSTFCHISLNHLNLIDAISTRLIALGLFKRLPQVV